MLATVIFDVFSADRSAEMAAAIDDLCAPEGGGTFASSGLYAFWDPDTRDLLYIGLARDLGIRFRQHTGLISCDPKYCKVGYVNAYFAQRQLLGYSVMPQSPLDQADCARARADFSGRALAALKDLSKNGVDEITRAEGQLIRAHLDKTGSLPPWNHIGGSASGAAMATADTQPMLDYLRARYRGALTARRTLRELAADATAEWFESLLHVARFEMLMQHGAASDELLHAEVERLSTGRGWFGSNDFRQILDAGYLAT